MRQELEDHFARTDPKTYDPDNIVLRNVIAEMLAPGFTTKFAKLEAALEAAAPELLFTLEKLETLLKLEEPQSLEPAIGEVKTYIKNLKTSDGNDDPHTE
jgi:hypothetical protein